MGYYTRYELNIEPRPQLEEIERLGRVRRECDRSSAAHPNEVVTFFSVPVNEAIYQALFNDQMVFALGRGLRGGGERSSQWHSFEDDMRALSAAAPDHRFCLNGTGEESGDIWRRYFKGGKMQVAESKIVFDEFDERKLT